MCEDTFVILSQSCNCQQIFVGHNISYQVRGGRWGIDECSILQNLKTSKIESSKNIYNRKQQKSWSTAKVCSLITQQGWRNLNPVVPEDRKTNEVHKEREKPNCGAQETKVKWKYSDTSLLQCLKKIIFESQYRPNKKHTWQITGCQLNRKTMQTFM